MTATPGRFCDAMVTTNSGSATLMQACQVKLGVVNTGRARRHSTCDHCICPCQAAQAMPAIRVNMTA